MTMAAVLQSFSGKRVLITGHTGFKGSWLAFLLAELGAEVTGYALPPVEQRSHFAMLELDRRVKHVVGDIRDQSALAAVFRESKPEYVFHLAAQALVKASYDNPVETFGTNVMGSVNVLEGVRSCDSVRSLVYVTSDKCYENVEWVWGYRENDRLGGRDPYSASKAAAEIVFAAYASSFFATRTELGAATARAGNVIGGGDWADDRIVPDCIRAVENKKSIQLRNPAATRPWQHVLEPISGYLLLADKLRADPARYAGSWNFGPPSADVRTVKEVADSIAARLSGGSPEIATSPNQPHEANLLQLNCDKAHQLLGWRPRWTVDKTLAATADWYKAWLSGSKAQLTTRAQLRDYFPELS